MWKTRKRLLVTLLGSTLGSTLCGLACSGSRGDKADTTVQKTADGVITIYNAGSLAGPLKAVLDTFAAQTGVRVEQESGGSLELARKLTELGRIPDVIALADADVFPKLLIPKYVDRYTRFARNRMVLMYTDKSRFAKEMSLADWFAVLQRPGVETGRSDPNADPAGYRALLLFQLAEHEYHKPGLAKALEQAAPPRNIRPKSADLVALIQSGNLDYAWGYESVARAAGLRFLVLPSSIDLSASSDSSLYATAAVRVVGTSRSDTVTMRGLPIVYGIATPKTPPHGDIGTRFITFMMSPDGQRILRSHHLDVLDSSGHTNTP